MRILVRFLEHDVSHSLAVTMIGNLFVHLHIVCRSSGIANTTGYAMTENSEMPANPPTTTLLTPTSKRSHESTRAPAKSSQSETAATADSFGEASTTLAESFPKESLTATPTQLPDDTTSRARSSTSAGTQCRKAYTKEHLDAAALAAQKQAQNKDAFRGIANLTCTYDPT